MTEQAPRAAGPATLMRQGKLSYVEIPAADAAASASFYEAVFDWTITGRDRPEPHFEDTVHEILGAFVAGRAPAGEGGVRPYIYVDSVDATIVRITARGGGVVEPPRPEGDLVVAIFRDPAGNVIGIWQAGPR